jgi:GT2 family glycosyltransferase
MIYQDITVIIVSFHSRDKIFDCINSISKDVKIIVVENSNDENLKNEIYSKYKNIECILSKENLGYGSANNLALSKTNTSYALIINPDVVLSDNALKNFFLTVKKTPNFGILAPISKDEKYQNFNIDIDKNLKEVETVKGFAMFLNMKNFKEIGFFDSNFFLYFEEIDLCKKLQLNNIKIYIDPSIKVHHLGGTSHDLKFNKSMELSRNWHWMWSTFYFNKKHYGYMSALSKILPKFFSSLFKFIFNFVLLNKSKSDIYRFRLLGIINSILLKKSSYRPKI